MATQRVFGSHGEVELLGVKDVFVDPAILELADQGFAGNRDFIEPFATKYGERTLAAEALQNADLDADQIGMEDAEHLVGCAGGVGERAEDVEEGAHAEFATHRRGVLHGAVVIGGEHEADTDFVDALADLLGAEVDVDAERFEHVGAA